MKTTFLSAILLLSMSASCIAAPIQSLDAIQDEINLFVKSSLDPNGSYQISSAQIDPRLQLPTCEQALEIFSPSGEIKAGRNTVGIRCNSGKNWTIYSVVAVKSFKEVLVLTKPLRRNDIIRPEHLSSETRDTNTLQQGYVSNPDEVINKQASRNLPAGMVLNRLHYAEMTVIKRGERVNIQSGRAGLLISAPGLAMTDGVKGQQINVKNISSQRVIQATVVDPGLVSVSF